MPRARDHVEDLARARRDRELHALVDDLVLQHGADEREVLVGGVHRRADAHLRDLGARELGDRDDVAGRRRLRDERLERAEVDLLGLVVRGAVVGGDRGEVVLAALAGEPLAHALVAGEDRGRPAGLDDHVADRAPLGRGQRRDAGAGELEHRPRPPRTPRRRSSSRIRPSPDPRAELAAQLDAHDRRAGEREAVARHRHRDVEPARADREHPDRPGHRRVRVGADEHLARAARSARGARSGRCRCPGRE